MSAKVNVCNVDAPNNPSTFFDPFQFEITFECYENLTDDLEWKLVYVGSAENSSRDQLLDSVLVGPIPEGKHKFVFQADSPDVSKLPPNEIVGVTVVLLSCSYREQEFIKIGYYVTNEYDSEELKENPPEKPLLDKVTRRILVNEPRVTRLPIKWDEGTAMTTDGGESSSADANNVNDGGNCASGGGGGGSQENLAPEHSYGSGDMSTNVGDQVPMDCALTDSNSNAAQVLSGAALTQQG